MRESINIFKSVTVFVLTANETVLLRQTISKIKNSDYFCDIHKIVVVAKNSSCDGFFEAERLVAEDSTGKISIYLQKAPTIEQCIKELPKLVESSHFIIMAADMETDPDNISDFIKMAKLHPEAIICAAKWLKDSVVEGYGKIHELGSRVMNTFVSILFNVKAKDLFFIYQIYPLSVYRRLNYGESSTFVYEHSTKAIRNGVEYIEIPTVYKKRTEGKSHVSAVKMIKLAIVFCFVAIKVRFSKRIPDNNTNKQ